VARLALAVAFAATLTVAAAPAAHAGWFPATPVDTGASAFGGVDVARDGFAAVTYVKGGRPYLARMAAGKWNPPEQVGADAGSDPVVAVADGGALIVAWRSADRVLGAFSDGGPLSPPVVLGSGDVGPPDVDMAIQRTAYVTFRQAGDVRVVRLRKGLWEAAPAPMDIDPAADASGPRVVTAADGNALTVWSERGNLYARRLTDLRLSALPQEVATGADQPDVVIEDDVSFAWVTYHQGDRVFARRLVGSLFDPAVPVDLGAGSGSPSISMNGDGVGLAASATGTDIGVAGLTRDAFAPATKVGSGSAPLVAGAESRDLAVVWQTPGGFVGRHAARDELLEPEVALGAGGGRAELAADRTGDMVLGWLQGDAVVTALWDEPPGAASLRTNRGYKAIERPLLRWGTGLDLWGTQTYRVLVDGAVVGTTTDESLVSPELSDGTHKWRVVSIDARGQETPAKLRYVRVDLTPPTIKLRKRSGRRLRVVISDTRAGVARARTDFGDGTITRLVPPPEHRYTHARSYRVTVRAEDAAGNVTRKRFTVSVR
jgi:PKD domain